MKENIKQYNKEDELSFSFFALKEDRKYFLENLAMLIGASVPINQALSIIRKDIRSEKMKKAIKAMIDGLEGGQSLSEVIEDSKLFAMQVVSLIKVGEKSGKLNENLKMIVEQQKKDESFKSKIASAVIYPFIILIVSIIVTGGISFFLLPKLSKVFSDLKIDLPAITKALMSFTSFIESYGLFVIPLAILVIFLLTYYLFVKNETKFIGQYLSFNVLGGKRIIQENELARFGYSMGVLFQSGLSISECFDSLIDSTDFYCYREFYKKLKVQIEEGKTFSQAFKARSVDALIPRPIQQMIIVSENSGNLPQTMLNIGKIYEGKIDNTTKDLSTILEPVLLVIIWVGILFLSLAILLPIYGLIGNFNAGI